MKIKEFWWSNFPDESKKAQVEKNIRDGERQFIMEPPQCQCSELIAYVKGVDSYMFGATAILTCGCGKTKFDLKPFQI